MGDWSFFAFNTPKTTAAGTGQITELTEATGRQLKFSLTDGATFSFELPGSHPDTALLLPGETDVLAFRDARAMQRFHIKAMSVEWEGGISTCTFQCVSYRTMTDRWIIHDDATRDFTQVEQTAIAWELLGDAEAHPNEQWNLTRGLLPATAVLRDRQAPPEPAPAAPPAPSAPEEPKTSPVPADEPIEGIPEPEEPGAGDPPPEAPYATPDFYNETTTVNAIDAATTLQGVANAWNNNMGTAYGFTLVNRTDTGSTGSASTFTSWTPLTENDLPAVKWHTKALCRGMAMWPPSVMKDKVWIDTFYQIRHATQRGWADFDGKVYLDATTNPTAQYLIDFYNQRIGHEFFHMFHHSYVSQLGGYGYTNTTFYNAWQALQPSGFAYANPSSLNNAQNEPTGFASNYGGTTFYEDISEVFTYAAHAPANTRFFERVKTDTILAGKIKLLRDFMRVNVDQAFGPTYWADYVDTSTPANQPPTSAFNTSINGLTVTINSSASTDPDGTITNRRYDFGDGTIVNTTATTRSHTYATGGAKTFKLTTTDNSGATSTSEYTFTLTAPTNTAPTASFTTTVNGLTVTVDSSASSDPNGSIVSRSWAFGDGATATGTTATRTYATGGTYTITLTVTDNAGATGQTTRQVTVAAPVQANQPPVAAYTSQVANLTLSVQASGSTDPDGSITSYAWAFGDGATATGSSATRTYAAAGTYQVSLTVTDDDGAQDTETKAITVTEAPVPGIDSSKHGYDAGAKVGEMVQNLSEVINGFEWDIEPDPANPTTALVFNAWNSGQRRQHEGDVSDFVLDAGGTVAAFSWGRDMANYANVLRVVGRVPAGSGADALPPVAWRDASAGSPYGRWERTVSVDATTQEGVNEAADAEIARWQSHEPDWQVVLRPGRWDPAVLWLGDYARFVGTIEPLGDLDVPKRVQQVNVTLTDEGAETVSLSIGRPPADILTRIDNQDRRIARLERG